MPKMTFSGRATKYARDVVSGKITACEYVQMACKRHLDDLVKSSAKDYPYRFDGDRGDRVCRFAENMVHVKGVWSGQKIVLEDWQCFILAVPFGWIRKSDGLRRFRELRAFIPRKNAKSVIGAVIGLYMLVADKESGAEVYAGATSERQALEVFRPAWLMVNKNPEFKTHFGLELGGSFKNPLSIYHLETASRFERVIGKPGDGASPSCAIVDEYHEHKTSDLYDTMDTGMGARTQPMKLVITTSGTDTSVPCYDLYLESIKILDGTRDRENVFVIIYTVDRDDDWKDFSVWKKANPNYDVSVYSDFLKSQYQVALTNAGKQNIILCKHLNLWMNAGQAWMSSAAWDKCMDQSLRMDQFLRARCWAALDLASKIDICSMAVVFEAEWGWAVFCKHYLPEETVSRPENDHYRRWASEGWLTVTEGARTDFHQVEDDLKAIAKDHAVQELAFDPKEASYLIQNIQTWANFECVEIAQGPALMSEPMKEVEAVVAEQQLRHCGDPVFSWMMGNVVKKTARGGGPVKYYYPTKQQDGAKIDGAVALIMSLGRAMLGKEAFVDYSGLKSVGA